MRKIEGLYKNNVTATRVQEAWQEFHAFYHSLIIKKLRWWWKTYQTHLASITRLQISPFETVILSCFWAIPRNKISKHAQESIFLIKILKILCVSAQDGLMVWKRTFYGNVDLSTTCQCRQLKLNLLSMQIKIYCLLTNQTPVLLVQCALWTRAAVMLLQSLYFSPPPPHPRAIIIPDARPLGTFKNQDSREGKMWYV